MSEARIVTAAGKVLEAMRELKVLDSKPSVRYLPVDKRTFAALDQAIGELGVEVRIEREKAGSGG